MIKKSIIAVLPLFLAACSQFSHSLTSRTWHNMNAKYNATVDASVYFDYAEFKIDSVHQDNFSDILPILPAIDSLETAISKPELEEVIRLTSIVAERHSNSKFTDKSYLLLGKARLYEEDLTNAIEVFKYLNANHKKANYKNAALIWLMRAYLENEDMNKANDVAEALKSVPLSKENKADFFQIKAAFHQRNGDEALAAVFLEEALKYMDKSPKKARAYFIVGQLFNKLNRGSLAHNNWKKALKSRPSYEIEFNTNVELLLQGNKLGGNAIAAFNTMLTDRKNVDLKDKIYFKMANVRAENGEYPKAIEEYSKSVQLASDKDQKAVAYQKIADIYFYKIQDYALASSYYDSTLTQMNSRSEGYNAVKAKSDYLADFVRYKKTIVTEDSLQALAALAPNVLEKKIEEHIREEEAAFKKQQAEKEKQEQVAAINQSANPNAWFFYDKARLTRSRAAFIREWGNRPLEDNWRRRSRETGSISLKVERGVVGQDDVIPTDEEAKAKEEAQQKKLFEGKRMALMNQIPISKERLTASKKKQEEAYYNLGKIYHLQFEQEDNAVESFETLLTRFPETQYRPEALYFLAISKKGNNQSVYRDELLEKYPYSSFARQLKRGNAAISEDLEHRAEQSYAQLYEAYLNGQYEQTLQQTQKALMDFTGTAVEDKLAMLRIMLLAKKRDNNTYRIALIDFVRSYPASDLKPRVDKMLETLVEKK
ncbi:hypothetical protein LAG90_03195 [Marinilongibacter aquaticus]|uniref:type IX secretion system periplasmic lipoprotein PorW/SprE n=1 Tax=Marinilongibacter aquaticus TaxID=2975157 RepID=UPI0021BD9BDE|nr:hypothetical protein [Marinilongibacter aquaticus]UBM59655.1 hypothetical protein LAG90_03195 [Marinilongibacter aquaticus]